MRKIDGGREAVRVLSMVELRRSIGGARRRRRIESREVIGVEGGKEFILGRSQGETTRIINSHSDGSLMVWMVSCFGVRAMRNGQRQRDLRIRKVSKGESSALAAAVVTCICLKRSIVKRYVGNASLI